MPRTVPIGVVLEEEPRVLRRHREQGLCVETSQVLSTHTLRSHPARHGSAGHGRIRRLERPKSVEDDDGPVPNGPGQVGNGGPASAATSTGRFGWRYVIT